MRTRLMTGAFLSYGNRVLLMHRGIHKAIAPGMWSCIGGHIEPEEINDPTGACLREIMEETGIQKNHIRDFTLRYITIRNTGEEIRTGYYFTGNLESEIPLPECGEGTLHWISAEDVPGLEMTFSVRQITKRLLDGGSESVVLCAINRENNDAVWVEL